MRKILGRAALPSILILVSNVLLIGPANAADPSILEPASGAWLGFFYGAGNLAQTTAKLGRTPRVHLTYYAWTDDWTGTVTQADLAAGRIPLVNWPRNLERGIPRHSAWRPEDVSGVVQEVLLSALLVKRRSYAN